MITVWLDRHLYSRAAEQLLPGTGDPTPLLEAVPFGLLLLDRDRCSFANPYACRLLQLEPSPAALPDGEWVAMLARDRQSARGEKPPTGRLRTVDLNEERVVRWWVMPWDNQRDLCVVEDITSQRRAEQNAHRLISDLSHELRTPLATILTHLEILRLPTVPSETHRQSLRLAEQESQRMSRMVQNLLELSRLESNIDFEGRPVPLLPLLEGIVAQLASQAEACEISLSCQADAQLPPVIGEEDRLRQLFLNLLDNAIKYGSPGDRVEIALHRRQAGILCQIADNGPGIPEAHLPYVTHRFYRAVDPGEADGNGLGLALAAEILRRHQSRLEIDSTQGTAESGTCVRFLLPTVPAPEGEQG